MVGIREIAKKANVSPTTVSRVLNHDKTFSVSTITRNRIFKIATDLNYNINTQKQKRIPSIGIISTISKKDASNGYYRELHIGLEEEARRRHLGMNRIYYLPDNPEKWKNLEKLGAVIIIGSITKNAENSILTQNKQIIIIDSPGIFRNSDVVCYDLELMTRNILELFLENGHQNIAYIGGKITNYNEYGQPISVTHDVRTLAYMSFMEKYNLKRFLDYRLGDWDEFSGENLTRSLLERNEGIPTALLIGNDSMAIGAYKAIKEKQLIIGKDIVLVSFDNLECSDKLTPKLTSMEINARLIGKTAVRTALERIDSIRNEAIKVTYVGKLIIKDSFIPANNKNS